MKHHIRSRVFAVGLLFAWMLLLLTGCHGNREHEQFEMPETFDTSRDYEITFWAKNDTNNAQVAVYHQAIADFEALYPNIRVNIKLYTDYNRIYEDVITNIQTDTTPNVCITYPDHIATYASGKNTVVALDRLLTDAQYGLGGTALRFDAPTVAEIVPQFLEEGRILGEQFALPFMRSTEVCYINRTYVEKLGYTIPETLTWDFIFEVSAAAMETDVDGTYRVNGQTVLIPFIYKSTDNMMIQMLKQKGAEYSSENGDILIFNEDTEDILYTVAAATENGSFSTFKISSYPANYLNAGQCIFAIDSTAGSTWMGSDAPLSDIHSEQIVEFETVVTEIPQYDVQNPQMISQGPSVCLFNKTDPQEVLASWLFLQFLLTDDVQIAYAKTEGYVPVTKKAQTSEAYLEYLANCGTDNDLHYHIKIEASELLLNNIEHTFITPVFNGSANLRNAAGQMIEEVTKSIRRHQTVDDAYMQKLFADMTAMYHLDSDDANGVGKASLGALPAESVALLATLGGIWLLMGGFCIRRAIKRKYGT